MTGILVAKSPTEVCLDVGGMGYAVHIPLTTFDSLPETGQETTLHTHLHVREDSLQLYGFIRPEDLDIFTMLLSVSGIGPRMALGILSGTAVQDLRANILSGHVEALTAVPGIGRKLAERMVMELRDKIGRKHQAPDVSTGGAGAGEVRTEAVLALITLGFSRPAAEKAVQTALARSGKNIPSLEDVVKKALRLATR